MRRLFILSLVAALIAVAPMRSILAEDAASAAGAKHADRAEVVARGVAYFAKAQAEDGSFSKEAGPAVTALVAAALINSGQSPDDPVVARALEYVLKNVRPDGGIYSDGSKYKNYETCVSILCFSAANADNRYDKLLKDAEKFAKGIQWGAEAGSDPNDPAYGGAGYGGHARPDLSNTSFLLDALHELDVPADDPAIQRALVFVSRCQNLPSEHNQTKFADLNPDGGFYYTIAAGGSSPANSTPNGGLRSYGSMTYAGLKSMIYAGVDKDDQRVKAALEWAKAHYTLEENPGMGAAGVYYYYQTFAKSLATLGEDKFVDEAGVEHDWRQELTDALAARQQADGSWKNENERWLESDPNLVTGYALLALSHCE